MRCDGILKKQHCFGDLDVNDWQSHVNYDVTML